MPRRRAPRRVLMSDEEASEEASEESEAASEESEAASEEAGEESGEAREPGGGESAASGSEPAGDDESVSSPSEVSESPSSSFEELFVGDRDPSRSPQPRSASEASDAPRIHEVEDFYEAGSRAGSRARDEDADSNLGSQAAPEPENRAGVAAPSVISQPNAGAYLGRQVAEQAPVFNVADCEPASKWIEFGAHEAGGGSAIVPVRCLVMNVPAELFAEGATKLAAMKTPAVHAHRAAQIAQLMGLLFSCTGKGWVSGPNHVEFAKKGNEDDPEEEKKKVETVKAYLMSNRVTPDGPPLPMFVFGYEELYDEKWERVEFVRLYKFVFDQGHSCTELLGKVLAENAEAHDAGRASATAVARRRTTMVREAAARAGLAGGAYMSNVSLEKEGANQWLRATSLQSVVRAVEDGYSGKTTKVAGLSPLADAPLPRGWHLLPLERTEHEDSHHPFSLPFVFAARRKAALEAGLVHLSESERAATTPSVQVDPAAYWRADGSFCPPAEVLRRKAFYLLTDPFCRNLLDAPFPRALAGDVTPGPHLLDLFRESCEALKHAPAASFSLVVDHFNSMTMGRDAEEARRLAAETSTVVAFDSYAASAGERAACTLEGGQGGVQEVMKPRAAVEELAAQTETVFGELVRPFVAREDRRLAGREAELAEGEGGRGSAEQEGDLEKERAAFQKRHVAVVKDVVEYKLRKLKRVLESPAEVDSVPPGWRAMASGLAEEIAKLDGTANLAHHLGFSLVCRRRSVFGSLFAWIGLFFETEMFVDGRDWRLIFELLLTAYESFTPITLILLFCGTKGNGKSLRTERMMRAFVKGWFVEAGNASEKAKVQGAHTADNGRVLVHDEMIADFSTGKTGENMSRVDEYKTGLLKREVTYEKAMPMKRSDGAGGFTEGHRSVKTVTPWNSCHVICTNQGPAMRPARTDPGMISDSYVALVDRSVCCFVRTLTDRAATDPELESNLKAEHASRSLAAFRVITCLVGLARLLIWKQPSLAVDNAYAMRLFAEWDSGPHGLATGFCLPLLTPRKRVKREQNLDTLTCFRAVAEVFVYQQTAQRWPCCELDSAGAPQPFRYEHMYHVLQAMHPTPEVIAFAWSTGLEYNTGTSVHGLNAMTALLEFVTQQNVSSLLAVVPRHKDLEALAIDEQTSLSIAQQADIARRAAAAEEEGAEGAVEKRGRSRGRGSVTHTFFDDAADRFERLHLALDADPSTCDDEDVGPTRKISWKFCDRVQRSLRRKREALGKYRALCHQNGCGNQPFVDLQTAVTAAGEGELGPDRAELVEPDAAALQAQVEEDEDFLNPERIDPATRGAVRAAQGRPPPEEGFADPDEETGYHRERAMRLPGRRNCIRGCRGPDQFAACPYCSSDYERREDGPAEMDAESPYFAVARVPRAESLLIPTVQQVSLFYPVSLLAQWCVGRSAEITGDPLSFGCHPALSFVERKFGDGSAATDFGWLGIRDSSSWAELARRLVGDSQGHAKLCDFHVEGLTDVLWMLSGPDCARRVSLSPFVSERRRPNALLQDTISGGHVTHTTGAMQPNFDRISIGGKPLDLASPPALDPVALVTDNLFSRAVAQLVRANLLPAVTAASFSNCVAKVSPVSQVGGNVRVCASAMFDHAALLQEAVLGTTLIPGARARTETASGVSPPAGVGAQPDPRKVYPQDRYADTDNLSYSNDTVSCYISSVMAGDLINDMAGNFRKVVKRKIRALDDLEDDPPRRAEVRAALKKLLQQEFEPPHHTSRFAGFEKWNRSLITFDSKTEEDEFSYVCMAEEGAAACITRESVTAKLGRRATDYDVEVARQAALGNRSLRGVEGNLWLASTWMKHAMESLVARGLCTRSWRALPIESLIESQTNAQSRVGELCEGLLKEWRVSEAQDLSYSYLEASGLILGDQMTKRGREKPSASEARRQKQRGEMHRQLMASSDEDE